MEIPDLYVMGNPKNGYHILKDPKKSSETLCSEYPSLYESVVSHFGQPTCPRCIELYSEREHMHTIEAVQWFPLPPWSDYPAWVRDVVKTGRWETPHDFTVTTPDGAEMTIRAGDWFTRDEATGEIRYERDRRIKLIYEPAGMSESGVQRFAEPDFMKQQPPYNYIEVARAACAKAGVEFVHAEMETVVRPDNTLMLKWREASGDEQTYRWVFDLTTPGTAFLMIYDEIITGKEG